MKTLIQILFWMTTTQIAIASPDSVFEDQYLWPKKSITVCWGTIDEFKKVDIGLGHILAYAQPRLFSKKLKKIVQNKVQAEYTLDAVGIEFIGWSECSTTAQPDILVMGTDEFYQGVGNGLEKFLPGQASVGTSQGNVDGPRVGPGYVFLNQPRDSEMALGQDLLLLSALHEFGHATGLRHEHIRKGAQLDKNCIKKYDEQAGSAKTLGLYDEKSVMNYCYENNLKQNGMNAKKDIKLSFSDRATLLCLYRPDKAITPCDFKILKDELKK